MSPRRILVIVGILIIIVPFLGIPIFLRTSILCVLGIFVIVYASILHTKYFSSSEESVQSLSDDYKTHIDSVSEHT